MPWTPTRPAPISRLAAAAVLLSLLFAGPARPAVAAAVTAVNAAARDAQRGRVLFEVRNWPTVRGAGFSIHYPAPLAAQVPAVQAAVSLYYPEVLRDYGLTSRQAPADVVVVTAGQMARFVGGASLDPPLGAYYEGVVWLLAPEAFLPAGPDLPTQYAESGPVAHELTHLADAVASGGRTPAWLDEGLAQYEDWRLTGYVWVEPDNQFVGRLYSWSQLTGGWSGLPNVALAYRQALAATADVCRTGPGTCVRILHALRAGEAVRQALTQAVGPADLARLESGSAWSTGPGPLPDTAAGPVP